LLDLDRVSIVESPRRNDHPVVVVVVDRRPVAIRLRRLITFAPAGGFEELDGQQAAPLSAQALSDRAVFESGSPYLVDGVGAPADHLDVYPEVVILVHCAFTSLFACKLTSAVET
jgi:hypothetical protein